MLDTILERLARSAPRKIKDEEGRLHGEIKKLVSRIRASQRKANRAKSARGGLQSAGARGVLVKENDIYSRRVVVKASYISSSKKNYRKRLRDQIYYAAQEKIDDLKNAPELYGADDKLINVKDLINDFEKSPHVFSIIVSPEDASELDLKEFTRNFISVLEKDLNNKLDWVAGNHYDTNDPHVHLLIKGTDEAGNRLLMKRDYISNGLRARAGQVVTNKLGLRSFEEVVNSVERRVLSTKRCELDDIILKQRVEGTFDLSNLKQSDGHELPQSLFVKRLEFLESKELAKKVSTTCWRIEDKLSEKLQQLDRANTIISKLSDGLKVENQDCEVISAKNITDRVIKGYVVERGYVEDGDSKEYLLIKSKEEKFLYVELEKHSEKAKTQVGEFVRIDVTKPFSGPLATDKTIEKCAANSGIYDVREHERKIDQASLPPGVSAADYARVHVNRLELLHRKGIVNKLSDGSYKIPRDYIEKIDAEGKKSKEAYRPHIKVIQLSPARFKQAKPHRGLAR